MAISAVWVSDRAERTTPKALGNLRGAAVEASAGPSARLPDHFDLQPVYAVADAGAQRLGRRFLGSETGGKALGRVALAQAIGLLRREINAVEKTLAVTVDDCWMRAISTTSIPEPAIISVKSFISTYNMRRLSRLSSSLLHLYPCDGAQKGISSAAGHLAGHECRTCSKDGQVAVRLRNMI